MSADLHSTSPYRGLEPFSEAHAPFFFGRERMSEIVSTSLLASRVTVIYGPSGVGKSSLLSAGVVHRLRRQVLENIHLTGEPGLAIAMLKNWSGDPLEALMTESRDALARALDDPDLRLTGESSSFVDWLRERTTKVGLDLLLVLDQFEEFFVNHSNEQKRDEFAGEFARLIQSPGLRVNALISIRDDCYTRLGVLRDEDIFNLFDYSIPVSRLTREEARAAIEEPIRQYNRLFAARDRRIEIEPELIDAVLDGVGAEKDLWAEPEGKALTAGDPEAGAGFIEATFLQLVMAELWKSDSAAGRLRLETLKGLGSAQGIARNHLLEVLNSLTESERNAAETLFRHLVTASRTKIAYPVYDLFESGEGDLNTLDST
jgi:hypothetical protein